MDRVSLIPEEAVEAYLADLKRFITDSASSIRVTVYAVCFVNVYAGNRLRNIE